MLFGILGPLRVGDDAGDRVITAGRDRVVLGMLLAHANRVVPVEQLVDAVWGDAPPATARAQLQTCVSRLRRAVAAAGASAAVIMTDPAGYRLPVRPDDLDVLVFERLIGQARAQVTADRPAEAAESLRAALGLWRGPALAGIASMAVRQHAAMLDEQRAVVVEDRVELELALGRERELLAELTGLVQRYPLRERLRAQYLLALYRSGRQADALAEYRRARDVLRTELGIEPGADLQAAHRSILAAGAAPAAGTGRFAAPTARAAPAGGADGTGVAALPPARCLPRTVADFTGRQEAVHRLLAAIAAGVRNGPVIQVIDGMAGSGKSTLALHVAGLVGDRFPDAQLFIDLHGHSQRAPVVPAAALVTLLRQLGVPSAHIPPEFDERVALWRSALAARRALVVLDNAASSSQVEPLLPTTAGSLALVTSRRRLTGLDGVRPEPLPLLSPAEAVTMLARIAGDRVAAEPEAAAEVVRRCGYLPLAIRLAGARLAHRTGWRVADLSRRLADAGAALPELAAEDRTVSSAFALSYGHLPGPSRWLFRLLGVQPTGHFDALAVAALADLPYDEAVDLLDDLVDQHLVEEPGPGVYRLHDLVREYAAGLAHADAELDRSAAIGRLLNFHLHAAVAAAEVVESVNVPFLHLLDPVLRPDLVDRLADPKGWLERVRPAVAAILDAATEPTHRRFVWQLPRALWRWLYERDYYDDIVQSQRRALEAARLSGDDYAEAMSLNYLASAYFRTARYPDAAVCLERALELWRRLDDLAGRSAARANLSAIYALLGRLTEAEQHARAALRDYESGGLRDGEMRQHGGLGNILTLLGRYDEALRHHRRNLAMARSSGDALDLVNSLADLAHLRLRRGELRAAERLLTTSLAVRRRRIDRLTGGAEALNTLGCIRRAQGRHAEALLLHRSAAEAAGETGERRWEAVAYNDLGITLARSGDRPAAREAHHRALRIAEQISHPYEQGRAWEGLADCLLADDPAAARRHRERALSIFERLGVPERFDVERRLAAMRTHASVGPSRQDGSRDD